MNLWFLLATFLVAYTSGLEIAMLDENEPESCLEHGNIFGYSHCIKKRQAACGNTPCGLCNNNSCKVCNSNNCVQSCTGTSCNQCPTGNCCTGQNCNVCSSGSCCQSSSCNSCASACSAGCNTWNCRDSCIQYCQNPSLPCSNPNTCFDKCRTQCSDDACFQNCIENCKSCTKQDIVISKPDIVIPPSNNNHTIQQLQNYTINMLNKSPVNITTVINLKNYILNNHTIHVPVSVNNTNYNYMNGTNEKLLNVNFTLHTNSTHEKKCCFVVHPVHCNKTNHVVRCYQKRHWECSHICTSVVVRVVHVPRVLPVNNYVPVPQPYPVPQHVPVPQPVAVPQPIPVPQPVVVQQRVPVPVVQPIPVHQPVVVQQRVPVPVVQPIPVPQPVVVQQRVPVPVVQPIPVPQPVVVQQRVPVPVPQQPYVVRMPVYYPIQVQQSGFTGYANRCYQIAHYPWIQCSRYAIQNCGSCFSCGTGYNPSTCSTSAGCAVGCRNNLFLNDPYAQQLIQQYAPYYTSHPQVPNKNVGGTQMNPVPVQPNTGNYIPPQVPAN